jgi:hypothetical protein
MTYPRAYAVAYAVAGIGGIGYAAHNGTVFDEVIGGLWTLTCLIGIALSLRTVRTERTPAMPNETGTTSRDVVPPATGTPAPRSRVIRKVPTQLR